jgi:hypothetical protein
MNILEKEIEQLLFENLDDKDLMLSKGFIHLSDKYYRQLDLGDYGVADIIGLSYKKDKLDNLSLEINIYELKKELIDVNTLLQASRYYKGIESILNYYELEVKLKFNIILIGKNVQTTTDFIYLTDLFDNLFYYTYSLDFTSGIKFIEQKEYSLKNSICNKENILKIIQSAHNGNI